MPDTIRYQFFAREPFGKTIQDCRHDRAISKDFYAWTPFSAKYKSKKEANGFLQRNGEFWRLRGVVLELFCEGELANSLDEVRLNKAI